MHLRVHDERTQHSSCRAARALRSRQNPIGLNEEEETLLRGRVRRDMVTGTGKYAAGETQNAQIHVPESLMQKSAWGKSEK